MKVLFVPVYDSNPYQHLLGESLRDRGVDVTGVRAQQGRQLLPLVREEKPDVVHVQWTHGLALARSTPKALARTLRFGKALLGLERSGVRLVWTVHNILEHDARHPKLELLTNRLLARVYDGLIVHSDCAREELVRAYRLPPHVASAST